MLVPKIREMHRRLLARRQSVWGERISENAADKLLHFYEWMFVGYAQTMPFLVLFVVLEQLRHDSLATTGLAISGIIALSCFLIARHYGKEAGVDIARTYGLPDGTWWKVKAKTTAKFDRWLTKELRKQELKDRGRRLRNPEGDSHLRSGI
jgi:hypothetical protein